MIGRLDYNMLILEELQKLESLSPKYKEILRLISNRIRKDLWQRGKNDEVMYKALCVCREQLKKDYEERGEYTESMIVDYVWYLRPFSVFLCVQIESFYFEKFVSDVRLEQARVIIEKQWDDIINASDGSEKAFLDVFDDMFTKCIENHTDVFLHPLSETDILCRAVDGWGHNESRFVPWDNKKTVNRWNPPGKTYLYLSFEEKVRMYSEELSMNEYICLEEFRAKKGERYSFCRFKPVTQGKILDLSYNDVELWKIQMALDRYEEVVKDLLVDAALSNPKEVKKIGTTKRSIRRYVKKNVTSSVVDKSVIEIAVAKQYLKMICNTIYKKVDEEDNAGKEKAYKSFHVLALYLEKKGITGIIYPCTRTKEVVGKNLVLFNRYDAVPIEGTIREYYYS